ncbi:hypothetical protein [Xanthovirga aplysinae]|uniref:hypothetical protein n=1 Tax=Xanthovirga aplysinae TaxID=2529853 RepID=UPI0012BCEEED|nr:hypothetical protein [Xanthovirga aplysinae]MTI31260.1 hypothetical protein [Xanthovirga aplysinae]
MELILSEKNNGEYISADELQESRKHVSDELYEWYDKMQSLDKEINSRAEKSIRFEIGRCTGKLELLDELLKK